MLLVSLSCREWYLWIWNMEVACWVDIWAKIMNRKWATWKLLFVSQSQQVDVSAVSCLQWNHTVIICLPSRKHSWGFAVILWHLLCFDLLCWAHAKTDCNPFICLWLNLLSPDWSPNRSTNNSTAKTLSSSAMEFAGSILSCPTLTIKMVKENRWE